jgi:hypothetical protein
MLEQWKIGKKTDNGLILNSDLCRLYKNRSNSAKPSIPTFQYSIIPWHMIKAKPIFSGLI